MKEHIKKVKGNLIDRYFEMEDERDDRDNYDEFKTQKNDIQKISSISKGTVITGHINTQSDLCMSGQIIGDISTTGHIEILSGTVVGNIKAASLRIKNSKVQGNIECQNTLEIQASEIIGSIKASKATLSGYCHGNIYVTQTLHLTAFANIKGDLQVKMIKIDEGAVVRGRVKVTK